MSDGSTRCPETAAAMPSPRRSIGELGERRATCPLIAKQSHHPVPASRDDHTVEVKPFIGEVDSLDRQQGDVHRSDPGRPGGSGRPRIGSRERASDESPTTQQRQPEAESEHHHGER
ncbi:MAG: hypothetical protein ACO23O_14365, partial [Ilumatobacteraceae bacterium]